MFLGVFIEPVVFLGVFRERLQQPHGLHRARLRDRPRGEVQPVTHRGQSGVSGAAVRPPVFRGAFYRVCGDFKRFYRVSGVFRRF